jgi:hypothetical protein
MIFFIDLPPLVFKALAWRHLPVFIVPQLGAVDNP